MIEIINVILILFVLICAVAAVRVKELVSAVFLLSAFSFFLAVLWSALSSPDVSFTEAMVGAGASTIFMLLALFGSKHRIVDQQHDRFQWFAFLTVAALGAIFLWASLDLPWMGQLQAPANLHVSPFYLKNAYTDMHTPNTVTAVVVDYRGFDTLIETTVIFTAGVACLLVIWKEKS